MKKRFSVYAMIFASITFLLAACGHHHGDDGDPNAAATVTVTADKSIALANAGEKITLTALVTNFTGSTLTGKAISFVVTSGTGSLTNPSSTTDASGHATVQLNRDPVNPPATREDITIKATADNASGTKTVRFINLPTSVNVDVALNRQVTNLWQLSFDILTSPTLNPTVSAIGAANTPPYINGVSSLTFHDPLQALYTYWLLVNVINTNNVGITTTPNDPIMRITFTIGSTITELPIFSIGPDHITANDPVLDPMVPAITRADLVSTTLFDTDHP